MAKEQSDQAERTLEPTALRLEEARRAGQVPVSADLVSVAVLLGGLAAACLVAPAMLAELKRLMVVGLGADASASVLPAASAATLASLTALVGLGAWAGAVAATAAQGGLRLSMRNVELDFGRLGVGEGLRRMVSRPAAFALGMGLAKAAVATVAAGAVIHRLLPSLAALPSLGAAEMAAAVGDMVRGVILSMGAALAVLALLDCLYRRWEHRMSLQMTPREAKEDQKRTEGDGQVRARRRRLAGSILGRKATRNVTA